MRGCEVSGGISGIAADEGGGAAVERDMADPSCDQVVGREAGKRELGS